MPRFGRRPSADSDSKDWSGRQFVSEGQPPLLRALLALQRHGFPKLMRWSASFPFAYAVTRLVAGTTQLVLGQTWMTPLPFDGRWIAAGWQCSVARKPHFVPEHEAL